MNNSQITAAIRVHSDAISALLDMLEQQSQPLIEKDPVCPNCGSGIELLPRTMGSTGTEYYCTAQNCDWKGEIE